METVSVAWAEERCKVAAFEFDKSLIVAFYKNLWIFQSSCQSLILLFIKPLKLESVPAIKTAVSVRTTPFLHSRMLEPI